MKKVLTILIAVLFFSILPMNVAKAEVLTEKEKAQYTAQVKQKKQIIKQKSTAIKKLELKIDDKSEELGKVLMLIFDREMPPSDENLTAIQNNGEAMINNIEKLVKTQHSIKRLKKEASIDVAEENYQQALIKLEKVIVLQDTEEEILKAYDMDLQQFIDLIKSLQLK
jgi:hypothetical protein